VADMDGDGDRDVVVGEHNLANPSSAGLFVFESLGSSSWAQHTVYVGDEHHDGVQVADMDGDGDLDIVSIGWGHNRVLLYENLAVDVQGNLVPAAVASATPDSGPAPLSVAFDGSASSDPDGSIVEHSWDFGDGTGAQGASTVHEYSTTGVYAVSLTVTDDDAATDTATLVVTVTDPVADTVPPVITLSGDDPQVIEFGEPYVEQGATAFDDVDGDLTLSIVIDAFAVDTSTAGTYQVTYDVTDSAGNAATQVIRTVEVIVPSSGVVVLVSSTSGGTVGGVAFRDEDVLAFDAASDTWSMYLDGSDVGLGGSGADVDAFTVLGDGSLLLSFAGPSSVPGVGEVDDSDIVRFVPTSLGTNTAGTYEMYFDGSDVGLTTNGEDIDAVSRLVDGRLILSTVGSFGVPGASGADEDLVAFTPTSLGASTNGTWALYFDGSDVGLSASSEDVNAAWVDPGSGDVYLSTAGSLSVPGVSGTSADVFVCSPSSLGDATSCTFTMFWDGSSHGYGAEIIDGFERLQ